MNYMNVLSSHEFRQWGAQFLAILFLGGGLALLAIGLGLIFNSPATLRFFCDESLDILAPRAATRRGSS